MKATPKRRALVTGFALPLAELLPGFLIPVVSAKKVACVQHSSADDLVLDFEPLSAGEIPLSVDMLRHGLGKEVVFLEERSATGEPALHAFFDAQRVYVGRRAGLSALLDVILPRIAEKLENYPNCLAGLCDFVGRHSLAEEYRHRSHVEQYQTQFEAKDTAILGAAGRIFASAAARVPMVTKQEFVGGARNFATLANARAKQYSRAVDKPLYAHAD